jgi:hypothetical protein
LRSPRANGCHIPARPIPRRDRHAGADRSPPSRSDAPFVLSCSDISPQGNPVAVARAVGEMTDQQTEVLDVAGCITPAGIDAVEADFFGEGNYRLARVVVIRTERNTVGFSPLVGSRISAAGFPGLKSRPLE